MNKPMPINYAAYESEKRKLDRLDLDAKQYELELKRIARKYGV